MKSLIIGLVALFSLNAFAGEIILSYQFGEKAQSHTTIPSSYYHVNRIDLYDDNVAEISLADVFYQGKSPVQVPMFFHVQSVQLTSYQMHMIRELVKELSIVPITVTKRTKICEIVVDDHKMIDHLRIRREWSYGQQQFLSGLELISTPSACWMPMEVTPTFHGDAAKARLLKLILQFAMR